MKGIIIGAGIGGLATAIALQMRQIEVNIFEAATCLNPIGAGILVPPNAMAMLDRYGLVQRVHDEGIAIESLVILDLNGKNISKTRACYSKNGTVYRTVAMHRAALQKIFLEAVAPGTVLTNRRCVGLHVDAGAAEAMFSDGTSANGQFLVGADGIHSAVRNALFPDSTLRYSGQTCWRGVSNITLPTKWLTQLTEVWGVGLRFGCVPITQTQVYWYATKRAAAGGVDNPADIRQILAELYGAFPGPVNDIILHTEPSAIIRDDISDLNPLKSWSAGAAILVGDAAHACTPNLGQGGAQAIEDSWVLAEKIAHCETLPRAFEHFQALRFAKVQKIVNVSWQVGRATNLSNSIICQLRNALFRSVPSFIAERQSRALYEVVY